MKLIEGIVLAKNLFENIDSYMPSSFLYQSNTIKVVVVRDSHTNFFKIESYNTDMGQTKEEVITSHIDNLSIDYDADVVVEVGYGYLKLGANGYDNLIIVKSISDTHKR